MSLKIVNSEVKCGWEKMFPKDCDCVNLSPVTLARIPKTLNLQPTTSRFPLIKYYKKQKEISTK